MPALDRRSLLLLVSVGLSGCIPVISTYYRPESSSGVVKTRAPHCGDLVKDLYLHPAPGIEILVFVLEETKTPEVVIIYSVAAGHTLRLTEDFLTVSDPGAAEEGIAVREIRKYLRAGTPSPQEALAPMYGETSESGDADMNGETEYEYSFALPFDRPEEFTVSLPPLLVDGARIDSQEVRFVKKRAAHLVFLCQ